MAYLLVIVVILSVYLYNRFNADPSLKLPPGPRNFPIIGNLQWLNTFPFTHFSKFNEVYGPIAYLKLGKTRVFMLNDTATWKEAYCRPELCRHPGRLFESVLENKGIVFGNGNPEIKYYMTKSLKEFGENTLEDLALQEISLLLPTLSESNGKPISVQSLFPIPTLNSLWMLLLGTRITQNDTMVYKLAQATLTISSDSSIFGRGSILLLVPFISKIFQVQSRNELIKQTLIKFRELLQNRLEEYAASRRNSEIRGITDAFFDKVEQTDPNSNSFFARGDSLHLVYMGLLMSGVDSTSTSLEWMLLFLATNAQVQEKFQAEISDIIGNRTPSLIDRERMPYTLAVIQEMLRLSAIDLCQFHQAIEDTELLGYDIPKGSILLPNVYGINRDPNIWGDPENFRPERFIDAEGRFEKSDKFISFGYGKRSCLGETIARDQIFLFSTSIFQRFNVRIHGTVPTLNGKFGIFHHSYPFEVVFEIRDQ